MTHEDIAYDRRVRLLEYAVKINDVAEACRVFGVPQDLLRVGEEGEGVRPVGVVAQAAPPAASARRAM